MVCTALTDHAGNGLVHLLVSNTTDRRLQKFSYEFRVLPAKAKVAGPHPPHR